MTSEQPVIELSEMSMNSSVKQIRALLAALFSAAIALGAGCGSVRDNSLPKVSVGDSTSADDGMTVTLSDELQQVPTVKLQPGITVGEAIDSVPEAKAVCEKRYICIRRDGQISPAPKGSPVFDEKLLPGDSLLLFAPMYSGGGTINKIPSPFERMFGWLKMP